MSDVKINNFLHSGFFHPLMRQWQSSGLQIRPNNLMYPIFIL